MSEHVHIARCADPACGCLIFVTGTPVVIDRMPVPPPCPVRSSITDQPCLLDDGHPMYSAVRFHKYARSVPEVT